MIDERAIVELAWLGLSDAGIAAYLEIDRRVMQQVYGPLIAKARAERAVDVLQKVDDGELNTRTATFVLNRVDPIDQPVIVSVPIQPLQLEQQQRVELTAELQQRLTLKDQK